MMTDAISLFLAPTHRTSFVVNVCEPSDFHARWGESRFRGVFAELNGARWVLDLRYPVRDGRSAFRRMEVLPAHPSRPIDENSETNSVVCRFVNPNGSHSAWAVGNLSADIEDEVEPERLLPQWTGIAWNIRAAKEATTRS